MPKDKQPPKELKVTDKRIFTPEGEIRDEFKQDIKPAENPAAAAAPRPQAAAAPRPEPKAEPKPEPRAEPKAAPAAGRPAAERRHEDHGPGPEGERRRSVADRAESPGTPFANFLENLIVQAYMSLGMLRNPYQSGAKPDPAAARQVIDVLQVLQEKTAGNLTPEEQEFLDTHLGELKLAYVQRTRSI